MKHSQTVGIIASVLLIIVCFLPWVYVADYNITLSGTNGLVRDGLTFGKQYLPHSIYCCLAILLFSIPKIWAKRVNLFMVFLNMSWAIKNFIIFTLCRQGICPEKKPGIYLLIVFAFIMLICSFLPKVKVKQDA